MSYGCIYIYTYTYLWYVDVYGLLSSWRCSHSGHCFQWSSEPRLCQGRLWRFLCFFSESKWFSGRQSPPAECDLLRPGCVADVEIVAFLSIYIYINTCIYTYCLLLVQCVFSLPILLCLGGSVCLNILYQATLVWGSTAEPPYDTKIYTQDMRLFENIVSLFLF